MSSQNKSWRQSISLELEATMPSKITFELCHFCYRHTKSICYLMYGTTEIAKDSTFVAKCKHFPKNCISRKNFHICYAFVFFDSPLISQMKCNPHDYLNGVLPFLQMPRSGSCTIQDFLNAAWQMFSEQQSTHIRRGWCYQYEFCGSL